MSDAPEHHAPLNWQQMTAKALKEAGWVYRGDGSLEPKPLDARVAALESEVAYLREQIRLMSLNLAFRR